MDILAALRSFLPAGGLIKRVTVYPSDYGLRRMQQEAAEGPTVWRLSPFDRAEMSACGSAGSLLINPMTAQGIYRSSISNGSAAQLGASELDDEEEMEERGAEDAAAEAADADDGSDSEAESGNDNDDADEVDREALRLYERSKLRWYYAVAECDSARTAAHLYAECDGMEYGLSACKFDLRFVPDAQVRLPAAETHYLPAVLQQMISMNACCPQLAHKSYGVGTTTTAVRFLRCRVSKAVRSATQRPPCRMTMSRQTSRRWRCSTRTCS